jgi:hypothetical protein
MKLKYVMSRLKRFASHWTEERIELPDWRGVRPVRMYHFEKGRIAIEAVEDGECEVWSKVEEGLWCRVLSLRWYLPDVHHRRWVVLTGDVLMTVELGVDSTVTRFVCTVSFCDHCFVQRFLDLTLHSASADVTGLARGVIAGAPWEPLVDKLIEVCPRTIGEKLEAIAPLMLTPC